MMGPMEPTEWRERIGAKLEQRRSALYPSIRKAAARAGISEGTWRPLESGRRTLSAGVVVAPSPEPDTVRRVAAVLGWPSNFVERLWAGESPDDFPDAVIERGLAEDPDGAIGSLMELLDHLDDETRRLADWTLRELARSAFGGEENNIVREVLSRLLHSDIATQSIARTAFGAVLPSIDAVIRSERPAHDRRIKEFFAHATIADTDDSAEESVVNRISRLPLVAQEPEDEVLQRAADDLTGADREPTPPGTYRRPRAPEQPEDFGGA